MQQEPSMPMPYDELIRKLSDNEYLADIFHVLHFDEVPTPVAPSFPQDHARLLVPQSLDALLMGETDGSDEVLAALIAWARPDVRSFSQPAMANLVNAIRGRYAALRQYAYVQPIADEDDHEIRDILARLLPQFPAQRGTVERMKDIVRRSVTTVLSHSKRTGTAILMRGRELAKFLRDRVGQLELPAKADAVVKKKTDLTSRLYAFQGGQAVRFFVGLGFAVAGLVSSGPVAAVGGLLLAFVDP
jgi:hypothetical protein